MPRQETSRTNDQEEVIIPPLSNQQVREQSVNVIEMEPNQLNIEVRIQRGDMGTDREKNIPIIQASGNSVPHIDVGESTPSPHVHRN